MMAAAGCGGDDAVEEAGGGSGEGAGAETDGGATSDEETTMRPIDGTIRFDETPGDETPVDETALVVVRLLDVSMADAPSVTITELELDDVAVRADARVAFSIAVPEGLDARGDYIISAHADVDRSGTISVGDFLTTASHPVAIDGSQGAIEIRLQPVR